MKTWLTRTMRLSKRAISALDDTVAKALRTSCVIRIYANDVKRAADIFDGVREYLSERGARPCAMTLSFFFQNSSCIKIVVLDD